MKTTANACIVGTLALLIVMAVRAEQRSEVPKYFLEAPEALNIAGVDITFETYAYLNLMPRVFVPNHVPDCATEGPLIVVAHFNVTALPEGVWIEKVWVRSEGRWWSGRFDPGETGREGGRLVMVARGCPVPAFRPGTLVDVIVRVKQGKRNLYLRAPKQPLRAVH